MQAGILNRQHVGIGSGLIVVGMPIARWCHKGCSRGPIFPMPIENHSLGIQLRADHGVAAGLTINSKIKRDGLVAVRSLYLTCRQDPEHGPKRMGDCSRLWEIAVAQQNAHAIGSRTARTVRNFV